MDKWKNSRQFFCYHSFDEIVPRKINTLVFIPRVEIFLTVGLGLLILRQMAYVYCLGICVLWSSYYLAKIFSLFELTN